MMIDRMAGVVPIRGRGIFTALNGGRAMWALVESMMLNSFVVGVFWKSVEAFARYCAAMAGV